MRIVVKKEKVLRRKIKIKKMEVLFKGIKILV
jgi:hypothetical protein